jgi:glycosyltransferase involved in cell wall biosynthesis
MFDATLHLYPEFYPLSARMFHDRLYGWSARHATLVITGTETARQDIARSYKVPLSRIRVVPLAPAEVFRPVPGDTSVAEVRERYLGSSAPFFLFVGKLTARRNVPRLMEAFAELKRHMPLPHRLLVIGLNTTELNLAELAKRLGIWNDFRHVEYVPDEDLNLLYNGAEAFVMPYFYEAVSLTALEAQATGTPVIAVDTPGLRETTDGAALLMSTAEVPDIVDAMFRLAGDASLRRELAEKGLAHARRFSWQRCAEDTLAVIEEAAQLPVPHAPLSAAEAHRHD